MSKQTLPFHVCANIKKYKGGTVAFAQATGECTYDADSNDEFDDCYADIKVDKVMLFVDRKHADITLAYQVDRAIGGDISEQIHAEINRICQMLFYPEIKEPYENLDAERNPSLTRNF